MTAEKHPYTSFKENDSGQLIPEISSGEELPIGRYGRAWQRWIENHFPLLRSRFIRLGTWNSIAAQVDDEAEKARERLSDDYNKIHLKHRPDGSDFRAVQKWEKEKQLYIDHRIMEDIVYGRTRGEEQ